MPTNILTSERMGPVHLAVVDNRGEKFKESVKVFGGKGHKLGRYLLFVINSIAYIIL